MQSVFLHRPAAESLNQLKPFKQFLLIWAPALLGILAIAIESTPTFSASNTSLWLRSFVESVLGHMSTPEWESFHHHLRKTGHFIGYGTLCLLFLRAWLLTLARRVSIPAVAWRMRSWIFAVLSTALVASADEIHQTFLPSRTGKFSDIVLDTCGGIVLSGVCLGVSWWIRSARSLRARSVEMHETAR